MLSLPTSWLDWLSVNTERVGECWIWPNAINPSGYGVVRIRGVQAPQMVHRASWVARNGQPVPDGLEIDHTCSVRACCNPDHLEAVTHLENQQRSSQRLWASRPPIEPNEPTGSIRIRPGRKGPRYSVLYRDFSSGEQRQSSRTFGTEEEAKAFLTTLPPRYSRRRVS